MNKIRTFNAICTFHDNLGSKLVSENAWYRFWSPATYLPAAAITYGAFAGNYQPASIQLIYLSRDLSQ